mmetsp:Transcript_41712/g.116255  ORF Transcript_41712/g.116255 Transcript_41712/m.116255 type:complete len:283 (-) Transcript_41712:180-1028(-)
MQSHGKEPVTPWVQRTASELLESRVLACARHLEPGPVRWELVFAEAPQVGGVVILHARGHGVGTVGLLHHAAEEVLHPLRVRRRGRAAQVPLATQPLALSKELAQRALQLGEGRWLRARAFGELVVVLLAIQARALGDPHDEFPGGGAVFHDHIASTSTKWDAKAPLELKHHAAVGVPALDHDRLPDLEHGEGVGSPAHLVHLVPWQVGRDQELLLCVRDVEIRDLTQMTRQVAEACEKGLHGNHHGVQGMSRYPAATWGRPRGHQGVGRGDDLAEVPQELF